MRGIQLFALMSCAVCAGANAAGIESAWHHQLGDGLTIKSRELSEGTFEVVAEGFLDAGVLDVEDALTRVDRFTRFMPYVKEARVLKRHGATTASYLRLGFALLIEPRDYVVETTVHQTAKTGNAFRASWRAVPDALPEKPGVVRVRRNEGEWLAEGAGARTRLFCRFVVSPGGQVPSFAQSFARAEVAKLFGAVEQEANDRAFKRRTYSRRRARSKAVR